MKNILVIDDEKNIRIMLSDILEDEGYQPFVAGNWDEAYKVLMTNRIDVILLDVLLPDVGGLEILDIIKKDFFNIEVIMMSGHGNIDMAVKAIKKGAFDFLEKPVTIERVLTVIENALRMKSLREENESLKQVVGKKIQLIGESKAINQIKDKIESAAKTNARVLITGENGTGKEIVARSIHNKSERNDKPFIEVNCAAIPENLIESELFGHEKGAFTGAVAQKKGKFEVADGGTLFLDEVADMSLPTQAKVLRVLEEMSFERVGGVTPIKVDVRVLAATNKDIEEEIKNRNFREDLFYRLNVIPIYVPPLRERREDIPLIVQHFLYLFASENGKKLKEIEPSGIKLLENAEWKGNVRQLKNIIERLNIMVQDDYIKYEDVAEYVNEENDDHKFFIEKTDFSSLKEAKDEFEKNFIIKKLKENDMNISKTAQVLNIGRSHLHKKINSYDIKT